MLYERVEGGNGYWTMERTLEKPLSEKEWKNTSKSERDKDDSLSSFVQGLFFQDVMDIPSTWFWSMPSQYTPPSLVSATLVKIVFLQIVAMALGLVFSEVPGATPKKPFSGFMARRFPSGKTDTHSH